MYRIYGDIQSGNCYKIKLLLSVLGIKHQWRHVDILSGESRTSAFLARNPNGKIPLLELEDGRFLSESNAILNYLADGSDFLPNSRLDRARMLQWQFFEQYSHEPFIATARYINKYLGLPQARREEYESKQSGGHAALQVMEQQLIQTPFLVDQTPSIADISLFAYTHVAHEGGFDLSEYLAINSWLDRVRALPGFIDMTAG